MPISSKGTPFTISTTRATDTSATIRIFVGGVPAGFIDISTDERGNNEFSIEYIKVFDDFQRQGLGTELYRASDAFARSKGSNLFSSAVQLTPGKAISADLRRQGIIKGGKFDFGGGGPPLSPAVEAFLNKMLQRLLDEAYDFARPSIPSKTLQDNMAKIIDGPGVGRLYIDPYWAIYVHDGRAFIQKEHPLIYFLNPADDPRLRDNGILDRYDQWRPLTRTEFRFWIRINNSLLKAGVDPRQLPMQVRWFGYVQDVAGSFFFDNDVGMAGFLPIARDIVADEFTTFLETDLGSLLRRQTFKLEVSF